MTDLIKVLDDGTVIGNYWDNLKEFESRAGGTYGLRKDLMRRVEFEQNQHKQQDEQRKEAPDDQVIRKRRAGAV